MPISGLLKIGIACGLFFLTFGSQAAGQPVQINPQLGEFPAAWRYALYIHPSLLSDFNRVDGLVQSLSLDARIPTAYDRPPVLAMYSRLDVSTVELPHYGIQGGVIGVSSNLPFTRLGYYDGWWGQLAAEYHELTVSPDDWIVGRTENTLAALFTKFDYKNYHQIRGYSITARARFVPPSQVWGLSWQASWHDDQHRPLSTATQWSLLHWRRSFPANYEAEKGQERMLRFAATFEIKDTPRLARRLGKITAVYETADNMLGGDFRHWGMFCAMRLESATVGNQRLIVRLAGGARRGDLAAQHQLRLGGIGTLRGLPHQVMVGNRFRMINLEYRLGGDILGRLTFFPFTTAPLHKIIPLIDMGVLYDRGTAYQVPANDNVFSGWFTGSDLDNWGVFLSIAGDLVRLEWASTRFIGHEHADIFRIRTGWRL